MQFYRKTKPDARPAEVQYAFSEKREEETKSAHPQSK